MQLVDFYVNQFIGKIPIGTLKKALTNFDYTYFASVSNGGIILKNVADASFHQVIQCVSHYYTTANKNKRKTSSKNAFLACRAIQESFGIPNFIGRCDCKACHSYCLTASELKDPDIVRKKRAKKTKKG